MGERGYYEMYRGITVENLIAAARLERSDGDTGDGYIEVSGGGWLQLHHKNWIDEKRFATRRYEMIVHSYATYGNTCDLYYVKNGERIIKVSYFDEGGGGEDLSVDTLPPPFAAEVELVQQRENERHMEHDDANIAWGYDFVRSIFKRIARELGLFAAPVEVIFVKTPVVRARRFTSINGADATEATLVSVCEAAYRLDTTDVRSLRLDILDDGRRRSLLASYDFGELRIVAFGDGRFIARGETPLVASDAVLLFEHFYESGARAPTYRWDPA